jgi:hypothetical protein
LQDKAAAHLRGDDDLMDNPGAVGVAGLDAAHPDSLP